MTSDHGPSATASSVRSNEANGGTSPSTTAAVSAGKLSRETGGKSIGPTRSTASVELPAAGVGVAARTLLATGRRMPNTAAAATTSPITRIDNHRTDAGRRSANSNGSSSTRPSHHRRTFTGGVKDDTRAEVYLREPLQQ